MARNEGIVSIGEIDANGWVDTLSSIEKLTVNGETFDLVDLAAQIDPENGTWVNLQHLIDSI